MSFGYLRENWEKVLDLTIDHIELCTLALILAVIVAIPTSTDCD